MELLKFIEKVGRAEAECLAKAAGTNYAYLSQIAYGHRKASPQLALRIEGASNGAVTRAELRPDVYGEAPCAVTEKRAA